MSQEQKDRWNATRRDKRAKIDGILRFPYYPTQAQTSRQAPALPPYITPPGLAYRPDVPEASRWPRIAAVYTSALAIAELAETPPVVPDPAFLNYTELAHAPWQPPAPIQGAHPDCSTMSVRRVASAVGPGRLLRLAGRGMAIRWLLVRAEPWPI